MIDERSDRRGDVTGEHPPARRLRDDRARALLSGSGIPANPITFAATAREAANAARALGGPRFALKIVADGVVHKSRSGGVRLDVAAAEVADRAEEMMRAARDRGTPPTGVTVEPMVDRGIEVVVGAVVDPNFGPLVMFGSGGVDVERLGDVVFATAPVSAAHAAAMVRGTRVGAIVERRFPQHVGALAEILVAVGGPDGLLASEQIVDLDINPLVVGEQGVTAVDARASVSPRPVRRPEVPAPAEAYAGLRPGIYPGSIAVLGASADERKLGHRAVRNLVDFGYQGSIHPVTRSGAPICGVPSVTSVAELPPDVERAVVALPAKAVPDALRELSERGVRTAHIYTADTPPLPPEVGPGGLRVIGPNTVGHYTPVSRVTMIAAASSSPVAGGIAVVSQSGTYAGDVVRRGRELGLAFSFVTSAGNCEDVRPSEFLAFCEHDERTTASVFYLEGDADSGDFFRLAATAAKPVFLLKGGRTRAGSSAAASHTGALASDPRVLADVARQSGVVLLDDLDELMDVLTALQHVPAIPGDGLALLGSGGGVAVVGADTADRVGLRMAALSPRTEQALEGYRAPGVSLDNPVDIPIWSLYGPSGSYTGDLLGALAADDAVSAICAYLDVGTVYDIPDGEEARTLMWELTRGLLEGPGNGKPLALVLRSGLDEEQERLIRSIRTEANKHHVPMFDSVDRAITALGKLRQSTVFRDSPSEAR